MRTLYAADILQVAPRAKPHALNLSTTAARFHIENILRQAHWLGQMHVESAGFTKFRESLDYKATNLIPVFGDHRITEQQAMMYGRTTTHPANQEALANILYGCSFGRRELGNVEPGDGWRFIGRGPKQLTGRGNYLSVSMGIYGDDRLVLHPELLEESEAGCLSAGYFWDVIKNINPIADADDIFAVTKKVNGGTNGLEGNNGRRFWTARYKAVLQNAQRPDFSNVVGSVDTVKGEE